MRDAYYYCPFFGPSMNFITIISVRDEFYLAMSCIAPAISWDYCLSVPWRFFP